MQTVKDSDVLYTLAAALIELQIASWPDLFAIFAPEICLKWPSGVRCEVRFQDGLFTNIILQIYQQIKFSANIFIINFFFQISQRLKSF